MKDQSQWTIPEEALDRTLISPKSWYFTYEDPVNQIIAAAGAGSLGYMLPMLMHQLHKGTQAWLVVRTKKLRQRVQEELNELGQKGYHVLSYYADWRKLKDSIRDGFIAFLLPEDYLTKTDLQSLVASEQLVKQFYVRSWSRPSAAAHNSWDEPALCADDIRALTGYPVVALSDHQKREEVMAIMEHMGGISLPRVFAGDKEKRCTVRQCVRDPLAAALRHISHRDQKKAILAFPWYDRVGEAYEQCKAMGIEVEASIYADDKNEDNRSDSDLPKLLCIKELAAEPFPE